MLYLTTFLLTKTPLPFVLDIFSLKHFTSYLRNLSNFYHVKFSTYIFRYKIHTININFFKNSIIPNNRSLPSDEFFIAYTIKDNTKNYYYNPENGDWNYFNSSCRRCILV